MDKRRGPYQEQIRNKEDNDYVSPSGESDMNLTVISKVLEAITGRRRSISES
jgi:hypothetical protein